jgi:hypothetical protein
MTGPATETNDPLLAFVLSVLTPLLMTGDPELADRAAWQAIATHQTTDGGQLIGIAQTVGFALASLDNLRLSAAPDLSLSMKLKLRGNANALHRSTQRSAAALEHQRHADRPEHSEAETEAVLEQVQTELQQSAAPAPPAPPPETDRERIWANAMTDVAAECSRALAKLPTSQRRAETIRITALRDIARHLAQGGATLGKSALLNTTAIGTLPA